MATFSLWDIPALAQMQCSQIFSTDSVTSYKHNPPTSEMAEIAKDNFELFLLAQNAKGDQAWWNSAVVALTTSDVATVSALYREIPREDSYRAIRLLLLAADKGFEIPQSFISEVYKARLNRQHLRDRDMDVAGELSPTQQRDLTNMFTMLGIRRSKIERLFEKTKEKLGFESKELVPVIQSGKAAGVLGDEARLILHDYNVRVKNNPAEFKSAYGEMMEKLYALYSQRIYKTLDEPWFNVNGEQKNLLDFVNSGFYRQSEIKSTNTWMNVVTLDASKVQNPILKGYAREMWWNRLKGINPIGTVRIARNYAVDENGKETLHSVEVLRKGEDGFYVPYLFEADIRGQLQPIEGKDALRRMESCFQCHLRLNGVLFGGITMKGYKAVDDWHINNIDFTRRKFYEKFKEFRK